MGHEFEMYEITALTLMRNDARAARFTANVQRLEQQAPLLPATPHWCKTPRDVVGCPPALNKCAPAACAVTAVQAAAVTEELVACRAGIESAGIGGVQLAGMSEFELVQLAERIGGSRHQGKLLEQLNRVKEVCEAQVATMRHFDE